MKPRLPKPFSDFSHYFPTTLIHGTTTLCNPHRHSWWNSAISHWGYNVRNRLIADVFYDNGQEFIQFTDGKEILVETA
ncbi:hypothetical protein [Nostoc sp. FACHB-888]|uniref:hypothetical protein n=1 Tax=Nostoc sp. FACHB-888 TaxID=2692842 RepID=UPI0016838EB0|nr:hypothetical protein [Nostoc sp. FACHB-888]MBD2242941.1 hypothetical protein [Nostoc sp. FACHB-888]